MCTVIIWTQAHTIGTIVFHSLTILKAFPLIPLNCPWNFPLNLHSISKQLFELKYVIFVHRKCKEM